jgi:CheY-like chemotaxis protein
VAWFLYRSQVRRAGYQNAHTSRVADAPSKVVVVNGNTEVLGMLESVLDAGRDMVFVEPGDRAYSQIRRVLPDLVILCTRIEQLDGFQLLSMLKLDPRRQIQCWPTRPNTGSDFTVLSPPTDDDSMFVSRPAADELIADLKPAHECGHESAVARPRRTAETRGAKAGELARWYSFPMSSDKRDGRVRCSPPPGGGHGVSAMLIKEVSLGRHGRDRPSTSTPCTICG